MDIPALSMAMAQYNINSQVGVAMLDKSLDMSAAMGDALTSMIDRSAMNVLLHHSWELISIFPYDPIYNNRFFTDAVSLLHLLSFSDIFEFFGKRGVLCII